MDPEDANGEEFPAGKPRWNVEGAYLKERVLRFYKYSDTLALDLGPGDHEAAAGMANVADVLVSILNGRVDSAVLDSVARAADAVRRLCILPSMSFTEWLEVRCGATWPNLAKRSSPIKTGLPGAFALPDGKIVYSAAKVRSLRWEFEDERRAAAKKAAAAALALHQIMNDMGNRYGLFAFAGDDSGGVGGSPSDYLT